MRLHYLHIIQSVSVLHSDICLDHCLLDYIPKIIRVIIINCFTKHNSAEEETMCICSFHFGKPQKEVTNKTNIRNVSDCIEMLWEE